MARKKLAEAVETETATQVVDQAIAGSPEPVPTGHTRVRVTVTEFDIPTDALLSRLVPTGIDPVKRITALNEPHTEIEILESTVSVPSPAEVEVTTGPAAK